MELIAGVFKTSTQRMWSASQYGQRLAVSLRGAPRQRLETPAAPKGSRRLPLDPQMFTCLPIGGNRPALGPVLASTWGCPVRYPYLGTTAGPLTGASHRAPEQFTKTELQGPPVPVAGRGLRAPRAAKGPEK